MILGSVDMYDGYDYDDDHDYDIFTRSDDMFSNLKGHVHARTPKPIYI